MDGTSRSGMVFFRPNLVTEKMNRALMSVPSNICGLGISRGSRIAKEYVITSWTFSVLRNSNCLFSRSIL